MIRMTRFFLMSSVVIALFISLLSLVSYLFLLPDVIPLWYSLSRMQDQLADREWVFLIPALSWVFIMISSVIASRKELDETSTVLHNLGTTIVMVMFLAALVRILFLVLP